MVREIYQFAVVSQQAAKVWMAAQIDHDDYRLPVYGTQNAIHNRWKRVVRGNLYYQRLGASKCYGSANLLTAGYGSIIEESRQLEECG
jgi:hypothetical protein